MVATDSNRKTRWWFPSRRWLFLPPFLLGVGVVAALASSRKEPPQVEEDPIAIPLTVVFARRENTYPEVVGFGSAKAQRSWDATAEVGGEVVRTYPLLRSGIVVEAGEVLVEIDRTDYQLRLQQRQAELTQAKAQLQQLQVSLEADRSSLQTQKRLLAIRQNDVARLQQLQSSSAASDAEIDNSLALALQQTQIVLDIERTLATYPSEVASAEASVALAQSRVDEAQREVQRTTIVAPFRGTLSGVSLEPGQIISPNQQLFQIIDTSSVEVEAQFSIAQLSRVADLIPSSDYDDTRTNHDLDLLQAKRSSDSKSGSENWYKFLTAEVTVRSGDLELNFPASVLRLSESLDEQTRTLGVVIRVQNSERSGKLLEVAPGNLL